ncbi:protein spaetzle 5-like [Anthonomus grandis grandis]|uniref:protein spaetzle 5-like n=1 Tax=Anthonomus grandis grandis TaxID=2921223 RepID=UPI00216538FE|nr:protein spaetzle 5-like [Anthonomus grandis grandis]
MCVFKAIFLRNMRRLRLIVLMIWINYIVGHTSMSCTPEYGPNPVCRYLPAPPGKTPRCARPGYTYCEFPDHYPTERIYLLIQKWQFNHQSLIINEAKDDFNAMFFTPPNTLYGPPSTDGYHYPQPIYIPKPEQVFSEQGGLYLPPKPATQNFTAWNVGGYPSYNPRDGEFLTYKYTSNIPAGSTHFNPPSTYYINDIWKRNERLRRSLRKKRSTYTLSNNGTSTADVLIRTKRQSPIRGRPLCRSRSNFIMPKAALNSKGNWVYIVNTPETNQKYTQLVKSEMCIDSNCGGLCQLPQGYTSTCEQKYVQKRLIALDASGSDLYSDTFWFPSCCVCTVSNN